MLLLKKILKTSSAVTVLLLTACATPTFNLPVSTPEVSSIKYDMKVNQAKALSIFDSRDPKSTFSEGRINFNIQYEGSDIQEIAFLSNALKSELDSRGVPVSITITDTAKQNNGLLDVLTFKIVNHRVSGFSPLITFTQFSGDLTINGETKRLVSFIKRAKVPMWIVTEDAIKENTFNQPMSLIVQDIATRINQHVYNAKITDAEVNTLLTAINATSESDNTRYMQVYQLGFGNNPKAIQPLVGFLDSSDEYIRLAAISSLGLLKAKSEVPRLIEIFKTGKLWQDRAMALKALADIDTVEARALVDEEGARIAGIAKLSKEDEWNQAILSLYQ